MPSNSAAWITEKKGKPLKVDDAPYTPPGATDVVIKNGAVAINPVDWKIQESGYFIDTFPNILGTDVAGEIVEVGSDVKNFKPGQRVLGHCPALLTKNPAQAGFQLYTVIPRILVAPIPDSMSFSEATVLPLGISTAAAGLFQKDFLDLSLPSLSPQPTGSTLVVWGGSSSVGSCAIQLAKSAGYEVFTTASKKNHEYCKQLGADQIFDHSSSDVVSQIVNELKGKKFVGVYDAISLPDTIKATTSIAAQSEGHKFVATTLPPGEHGQEGVTAKGVFAVTILHNEVGPAVYEKFLPEALAQGKFLAKPDPINAGHGLEALQGAVTKLQAGVSAGKVVVTL